MLSIIICSINDAKYSATAEMYARLLPAGSFEMIRISDARSLAEGYNLGIAQSRGEHLLLCHDDLEILCTNFAERFYNHLGQCDLLGLAGTTKLTGSSWIASGPPHLFGQTARPRAEGGYAVAIYNSTHRFFGNMQALDGAWMAMHRRVIEKVQFDDIVFDGFHLYDTDFTFAAYLAGFRLGVGADLQNLHASGGNYDDKWKLYARRFNMKYAGKFPKWVSREFNWNRISAPDKQTIIEIQTPPTWEKPPGE